jgi:hydroxymethylbilane synthase
LNHPNTAQCVTAERSFLAEMGGGCASPVAAYAEVSGNDLQMSAISFPDGVIHRAFGTCDRNNAAVLGRQLATILRRGNPALNGPPGSPPLYAHRESSTRL